MANTGAHLVDRVMPDVPVRQLVLSLPHELRMLAAFKPDVLTALSRIFVEVVSASYRARAKKLRGVDRGVTGAVTLVQRFGGSLNLHVHYHVVFLDGVFIRDEQHRVRFHSLPPPEQLELDAIVRGVQRRAHRWLRKHGYVDGRQAEEHNNQDAEQGALEACAAIAMQRGSFAKVTEDVPPPVACEAPKLLPFVADLEGWNLHAGVAFPAGDDLGRERPLRYGARPPLALDRLRRLPGGRIAYRIKYARAGSKHRVMTPIEMMARLAALIPPPRYPLVRFHGVLGPRSAWRKDVVPRPRPSGACQRDPRDDDSGEGEARRPSRDPITARPGILTAPIRGPWLPAVAPATIQPHRGGPNDPSMPGTQLTLIPLFQPNPRPIAEERPSPALPEAARAISPPPIEATLLAPNILSVRHWNRLAHGELYAASRRMAWGPLLKRTFAVDVQECAKCHGRLRIIGTVIDPVAARAILLRLAIPTAAPALARARDPTELVWSEDEQEPLGA
jgi:Putative transposase